MSAMAATMSGAPLSGPGAVDVGIFRPAAPPRRIVLELEETSYTVTVFTGEEWDGLAAADRPPLDETFRMDDGESRCHVRLNPMRPPPGSWPPLPPLAL